MYIKVKYARKYMLEYVRGLLGLGWLYCLLVLGLIRDKSHLLRGQVSLACKSTKPLYTRKENPSLLPGRGQRPRSWPSRALAALARDQYPRIL